MKSINPILIFTILIAALSGIGVGLGIHYAVVIPTILATPVLIAAALKDAPARAEFILDVGAILFVASSLLWPKYAAFFLPGLPLVNPQRVANAIILLILVATITTNKYIQTEYKNSLKSNKFFWLCLFLFVGFRFLSVIASEEPGTSTYRYIQELFTHVVFILLGLHFGSNKERLRKFAKTLFTCLILVSLLGIAEGVLKKNIFSYFITPANEYMAWALSDKSREGFYRVKSTFDHPLTFAEFIAIGTPLAMWFAFSIKSQLQKVFAITIICCLALTSIVLSGSRSGYLALALSFSLFSFAPLVFTILHRKLTLARAASWSFLIIVISLVLSVVTERVYDYTFGKRAFSASDSARVVMLTRGAKLTKESPLYGHGVSMAAEKVGVKIDPMSTQYTIDSMYISIMVESGVIAIAAFISMLVYCTYKCWRKAAESKNEDWFLWHAIATAIASILVFKSILSLVDNNYLMYIILGLAVSRAIQDNTPTSQRQPIASA